ncbi:toprim domain-containing protein [Bartonella raoultii]|uniref:Toprim domain-containing protein n=1 Tax=Bartonella raoultii TaxID=1457020 RepID=A0ABS7ID71_9HYPH|nr:toprim domain-containing protein [Bartonella raoultii]MBX4336485.1 toprim domain-containing protein [Bartonella raoultii]
MNTIFEIKQKLASQASTIAEMLLPQGHKCGNNWVIGNTRGEVGKSLSICLSGSKAGLWYDFAEGVGGDLLDLWCAVKGITLSQALEEARANLHLARPKPFKSPHRTYRRPPVPTGSAPQNAVKTYLHQERKIPLDILKRYRIGEEDKKIIFPFYKPDGTLALVKERQAQAGAKSKPTAAQCEPILFGWQAFYPTYPTAPQGGSTSPQDGSTSSQGGSTSPQDGSTSPQGGSTSSQGGSTSSQGGSTAPQDGSTSSQGGSTSSQGGSTAPQDGSTSSQGGSTSPQDGSTAPQDGSTFSQGGSTSSQGGSTAPQGGSTAPQDGSTAPQDGSTSSQGGSTSLQGIFSSSNRTLVITEGEIDALSLAAYGYPAVSVPFGGGSGGKHNWIENEFDHLESFETIFLATDMDKPGEEAAHEIANRLGRHRCYRVHLPHKDANDCLTAGIDAATIAAAFASAKSFAPEGLRRASDYKNQIIGLFWPSAGQHLGYTVPYPKLKDKLYFRPAELTLWGGASGAGKSQLLSDCIPHWISQKSRLCLASLEMKGEQSLRRLIRQTGGLEHPPTEMIEQILHFLDNGLILYEHVGKSTVDTLLDVFDYCRARYGCDQFIIDSLMRLGISSDDYAKQEQAVYKMVDWAVLNAVHIHLVAHARKGTLEKEIPGTEDIKGASEIGANAFNIITIWRNRPLEDKICATSCKEEKVDLAKRPGVIINIAKQRSGDFEGKVGLWFDPQTYRYRCSYDPLLISRHYLERSPS